MRVWDLKEDNSFMAYDLYLDENYEFAADSLSGIWKTFVNASVQWDIDETIPLNGISVIYEWGVGISGAESVAQRYFGFNESDEETEAVDKNSLFFGSPYLCTIKRFIRFLRYSFFILLLVIWLDLIKVRSGEP